MKSEKRSAIRGVWAWACIFVVSLSGVTMGAEREFPDHNVAVTPPENWVLVTNLPPQPGLIACYRKADGTAMLMLIVDEQNKPTGAVDDKYVAEMELGIVQAGGGKRISGKFIEREGIKGYERLGVLSIKGRDVSDLSLMFPVEGTSYSVQALRFDGSASEDPEIRNALDSFRFLKPPNPPPPATDGRSAAFRSGESRGRAGMTIVAIIGAFFAIRGIVSSRKRAAPAVPPPLPPPL
jgi:hypothetical protein